MQATRNAGALAFRAGRPGAYPGGLRRSGLDRRPEGPAMTLDPQARAYLDKLASLRLPGFHTMPPRRGADACSGRCGAWPARPTRSSRVEDRILPPSIPLRLYRPARGGAGPDARAGLLPRRRLGPGRHRDGRQPLPEAGQRLGVRRWSRSTTGSPPRPNSRRPWTTASRPSGTSPTRPSRSGSTPAGSPSAATARGEPRGGRRPQGPRPGRPRRSPSSS